MPTIQLQPRDLDTLSLLGEIGLLDLETLHRRQFPGVTRRRCQQKFRQYAEQRLVHCHRLAVWAGNRSGRLPTLFTLSVRGAEVVAEATGWRPPRVQRGEPQPETLQHRLAVSQTRLALDDGFRGLGLTPPDWIMEYDRRPEVDPQLPVLQQRTLYHVLKDTGKTLTYLPDAACRMTIPRDFKRPDTGSISVIVFLEVDRSSERRGQVLGKLPGLQAVVERQAWQRYFPAAASLPVRLFFVCRSRQRIDALRESLQNHALREIIRLAVLTDLISRQPVSDPIWQDVQGGRREIVRLAPAAGGNALATAGRDV